MWLVRLSQLTPKSLPACQHFDDTDVCLVVLSVLLPALSWNANCLLPWCCSEVPVNIYLRNRNVAIACVVLLCPCHAFIIISKSLDEAFLFVKLCYIVARYSHNRSSKYWKEIAVTLEHFMFGHIVASLALINFFDGLFRPCDSSKHQYPTRPLICIADTNPEWHSSFITPKHPVMQLTTGIP